MIGQTVGDYRVTGKLGEGGFGVVYKAAHLLTEQEVAIKTIDAVLTADPKFRERFLAEARIQGKLKHPNVVVMHNFFEHDGRYYIVMEQMEGVVLPDGTRARTLADLIGRGPVPEEQLLPLFRQVLAAVGYAHERGVLHRDIKPLNMLFAETGVLKVGDFGIAKLVGGETSVSLSGARVGTPAYMSPEQVFDKKLTRATDIYSLGCTLYEMATGVLPFAESNTSSLLEAHVSEPPKPPRQVKPGISERLEQAILRAMRKKPPDRFAGCTEFAEALAEPPAADRLPLTTGPAWRVVPSVQGRTRAEAEAIARQAGCRAVFEGEEHSDTVPQGAVMRQTPAPGEFCDQGAPVRVTLSRGSRPAEGKREDPGRTVPEGRVKSEERGVKSEDKDRTVFEPSSAHHSPERAAAGGKRRKTGWVVFGVLAGVAAVILTAVLAGRNRGSPSPFPPPQGGGNEREGVAVDASRSLGKNAQGYEEVLWLKDSSVMVKVPAGAFTMGSDENSDEKPVHQVYLDEYYIDKYEVTNRQYRKFCDATGRSYPKDPGFSGMANYFTAYPDHPVGSVSWDDARAYCSWAGKRLPSEAEWEKAARGADARKYPWGNEDPNAGGHKANYDPGNYTEDGYWYTSPVGTYPQDATPYGCLDMAGNVWEWCNDWYDENYYGRSPERNPQGPSSGSYSYRVLRGGSRFDGVAGYLRCAYRFGIEPSFRIVSFGFRCAGTR